MLGFSSMPREFKPVRFFVLIAIVVFIVCGAVAFFNARVQHGRTAEERDGYTIGEKLGQQAPTDATLPTAAALNTMAQQYFKKQGSGNMQNWDMGFEHGYTAGFSKNHPGR
ncbi:MAG: hypothetical protein ACXWAV_03260 [Chthoniobacterales bacterium]